MLLTRKMIYDKIYNKLEQSIQQFRAAYITEGPMKKLISLILSVMMIVTTVLPMSLLTSEAENAVLYEEVKVSVGKNATIGAQKDSVPKITDGSVSGYVDSTSYGLFKPRENVSSSNCYVEIDLEREYPLTSVNVVTYYGDSRYYMWDVYVSNDSTLPISSWTLVGGKTTNSTSDSQGYTLRFSAINARYVRVYGTYNSSNSSFHWCEVSVYANLKNESRGASALTGKGAQTSVVTDGVRSNSAYVDIPWGSSSAGASSAYGTSGNCWVQIDLGAEKDISALNVVNYISSSRYYWWEAYAASDSSLPISSWTAICEKKDSIPSYEEGASAAFQTVHARYIRVYGMFDSANSGYHFVEVTAYSVPSIDFPEVTIDASAGFINLSDARLTSGFSTVLPLRVTGGALTAAQFKSSVLDGTLSPRLVFTDSTGSPCEISAVPKFFDGDVWYFEPVFAGFVPTKGQSYTVRLDLYENGDIAYSGSDEGVSCPINPVYVYDGLYSPSNEVLSWNGTPAALISGVPVLQPAGLNYRYFAGSSASADGFDLSYSFKIYIDGVEYTNAALTLVSSELYRSCAAKIDMAQAGIAPAPGFSHNLVIEAYTQSYPSGDTVLEARCYYPAFSASSDVCTQIGSSCQIYGSFGNVKQQYEAGVYTLTASGSDFEGYAFDGWYLNNTKISSETVLTFVSAAGEEDLIVGVYAPLGTVEENVDPEFYDSLVTSGSGVPSISYDFFNDLKGSAAGRLSFTGTSAGDYSFYWLDGMNNKLTAVMNGKTLTYSAFHTATLTDGQTYEFTPSELSAIPYGAKKLAAYKGETQIVSVSIPQEKQLVGTYSYAYGLMSDLHYNSFKSGDTDYAVGACDDAYTYFREAGITTVFQTGDYCTYPEELPYQLYAQGVANSGLLVLAAGGNHEVNGNFNNMFGENGLWFRYVNLGVYNGQVEGVTEIAPNGYDFVYQMPGTDDIFVFVCQEKWDGRTESQAYLISEASMDWLESVLETYKNNTVHLMLHTYYADDDLEDVDGEGDITNSVGYGYHYHYNYHTPDGVRLRELIGRYKNVIWFNGHSHWLYEMQSFNKNLNVFDYYGTAATCVHVPSVTAPRSVSDTGKAYSSNAGNKSQGTLMMRANGYEIVNGVDFKTGELLAYGCYIIYDKGEDAVTTEGNLSENVSFVYDEQTASLTISGSGAMPDYDDPALRPYADHASDIRRVYAAAGVTSVGKNAFSGFTSLETVELKGGVSSIGENAFSGDSAIRTLIFTDSVRTVGENAFYGTSAFTVTYDGAVERFDATIVSAGNGALTGAQKTCLKRVITFVFGDVRDERDFRVGSVPSYDGYIYKPHEDEGKSYMFAGWTDGLICFPNDLPAVTENAVYYALFNEMDGGTVTGGGKYYTWVLDLAVGVLTISGYGPMEDFESAEQTPWYPYKANITSVVVKKGVLTIGKNAFRNLTAAKSVAIENSVISIGESAMMGMTALKDLYLPATLRFGAAQMAYQSTALVHIYYDGDEETYAPMGEIFRRLGNNNYFTVDSGKLVFNTCVTHVETFTVVFQNDDGTVLATYENVEWGGSVIPPSMNDRDNEYFLGWDGNYRDITSDRVLTAVYSTEPDPDLDVEIEPKSLSINPYYGRIENYSGHTYFITGITSDNNEALFGYLKNGSMQLKATLKDENSGRSYVVDEYHFEHPGLEFYGTSFLRLDFCSYGVTPEPTHAYTISLDVYSGKNTLYRGTSAEGAFLSTQEAFQTNGAIIPSTIPYTCTVICTTHVRAAGIECDTPGVCIYCGEELPAGAHTIVIDPRVAPTATQTGLTEGSHCAVCGKIITSQEIIPATGVTGTNVALYKKVIGVGAGKSSITDGDTSISNFWDGGLYPSAAIIDLNGYYDLSNVNVITYYGDGRYYYFTVETSVDGRTWTVAGSKTDNTVADASGTDIETHATARYVKVTITLNSKNTSAHLVEVSVYGVEREDFTPPETVYVDPDDASNIAYNKPTRSNSYGSITNYVNDGSASSVWSAYYFPSFVDIDLLDNYQLGSVTVFMPNDNYTYAYTIYGSTDGLTFTEIAKTNGLVSTPVNGNVFFIESDNAYRILRVNVTACGGGTYKTAKIAEIKVTGTADGSTVTPTREKMTFTDYDAWLYDYAGIDISALKDASGKYDITQTYTENDTVNELNGMVDRLLGAQYESWFDFDVAPNPNANGKDYFKIEESAGMIRISGSDGVCIAAGLNWFLKYFCNVHISQETKQVNMPASIPTVSSPVFMETDLGVRYAYNYCTLSYTMAFFGYEDWRRELDWLYLNGVNLILDITGVEALWISYLQKLGYSADEAKNYACGPGYKAWWMMGNLENFNGTVSDAYVLDALEMARRNQRSMTVMGASPALQAFVGAMPDSFGFEANEALTALSFDPVAPSLVAQGLWQGFDRPNVLRTDYNGYSYLAGLFYDTQDELFGQVTDYFCGDVCHEGGKVPAGLTKADMSAVILAQLMAHDQNGTWILQRWQSNPSRDELDGMQNYKTTNVIVLDLASARTTSNWKNTSTYGAKEFGSTNWIFSSLDNFGGRPLMHGALQTVVNNIADAKANAHYMIGLGMTPEGTENNPVYYDLYWEMVWRDSAPNVAEWIADYAARRYGGTSAGVSSAWAKLLTTVYKYPNTNGTSGNYMIIGNRPRFDSYIGGYFEVQYSNADLLDALTLMMNDFDLYKNNECYIYDLVEIIQTYLNNKAQNYIATIISMAGDPSSYVQSEFEELCDKFLAVILLADEISSYSKNQLLGNWIGRAQKPLLDASGSYDDYMTDTLVQNAKMLISCWTSSGVLIDYANRLYNGLVSDYYYQAWSTFLTTMKERFAAGQTSGSQVYSTTSHLLDGLNFVLDNKEYQTVVSSPVGGGNARGIMAVYNDIVTNHQPASFEPTVVAVVDKYAQFGGISKKFNSVEFYSSTNAFETWPVNDNGTWCARASYHTLIRVNDSGLNYLATSLGTANYPYTWEFYYQEPGVDGEATWHGPYTAYVETKSNASFLRLQVADCPEGDFCASFEVGHQYTLLFDVHKGSEHTGFGVLDFTWTEKYNAHHDLYTDFWIYHDRTQGYRSGQQTVTAHDNAVLQALGIASNGAYTSTGHVHSFGEWTVISTDENSVTKQHICSSCGFTERKTEELNHEHSPVVDPAVPATCTQSGLTEGSHCAVCGAVITAQETVPALGHRWNEGTVSKQPSYTEQGLITYTCTRCGDTHTEAIPVLPLLVGDIDENRTLNILDVTMLLNILSSIQSSDQIEKFFYDVYEDGRLDINDVTTLLGILSEI